MLFLSPTAEREHCVYFYSTSLTEMVYIPKYFHPFAHKLETQPQNYLICCFSNQGANSG